MRVTRKAAAERTSYPVSYTHLDVYKRQHEIEEAQTLIGHFSYAVVVTDLRLSKLGFGGLDLVKHIREQALPIHIIVLTAYGWPELKAEASLQGADVFLRKPTRLAELGETVSQLIGGKA